RTPARPGHAAAGQLEAAREAGACGRRQAADRRRGPAGTLTHRGGTAMLIDSHCHLDAEAFDADRDAVVERARQAGVRTQVVPATHASAWPQLREVCACAPGLYPAYGLHPTF